jgi:hypothetical protein
MNLNTPPPVEKLDPEYASQIRTELVDTARKSQQQRSKWVPVLAAACGIAVIPSGVVLLTQGGGIAPAGSTPSATTSTTAPTTAPPKAQQVPANQSKVVSLDMGPASREEAREAARKCLAQPPLFGADPLPVTAADADTATVHQARWVKLVPQGGFEADRTLIQSFTTAKGIWIACRDSAPMQGYDPATQGSRESALNLNAADVLNGSSSIGAGSKSLWTDYSFVAMPKVATVQIRIRWTGGASPWYSTAVTDGVGYLTAVQPGASNQRGAFEIDHRALDAKGNEITAGVEYG